MHISEILPCDNFSTWIRVINFQRWFLNRVCLDGNFIALYFLMKHPTLSYIIKPHFISTLMLKSLAADNFYCTLKFSQTMLDSYFLILDQTDQNATSNYTISGACFACGNADG